MKKTQTQYKHAVIATDVAIFTVRQNQLQVLLMKMKKEPFIGMWALPGGLIKPDESIEAVSQRILAEKTGITEVYLEQFATFGDVDRDPFGRVVSVAYFALVPSEHIELHTSTEYDSITWFSVTNVPDLAYDHDDMLQVGLRQLQSRLQYSNVAFSLLPSSFTLTELQKLYEIILDRPIDKRNFRRGVLDTQLLKATGKKRQGAKNRPAQLYRFTSQVPQIVKVL